VATISSSGLATAVAIGTTTITATSGSVGEHGAYGNCKSVSVSAGGWHTIGLKSDGTLWAWRWNANGQLGDGTNTDRLSSVQAVELLLSSFPLIGKKGKGAINILRKQNDIPP